MKKEKKKMLFTLDRVRNTTARFHVPPLSSSSRNALRACKQSTQPRSHSARRRRREGEDAAWWRPEKWFAQANDRVAVVTADPLSPAEVSVRCRSKDRSRTQYRRAPLTPQVLGRLLSFSDCSSLPFPVLFRRVRSNSKRFLFAGKRLRAFSVSTPAGQDRPGFRHCSCEVGALILCACTSGVWATRGRAAEC